MQFQTIIGILVQKYQSKVQNIITATHSSDNESSPKKNGVEIFNIPTYPLVVISDDISPVCPHYGWLNPPFVMLDQAIFRCRLYPLLYYYIPID